MSPNPEAVTAWRTCTYLELPYETKFAVKSCGGSAVECCGDAGDKGKHTLLILICRKHSSRGRLLHTNAGISYHKYPMTGTEWPEKTTLSLSKKLNLL